MFFWDNTLWHPYMWGETWMLHFSFRGWNVSWVHLKDVKFLVHPTQSGCLLESTQSPQRHTGNPRPLQTPLSLSEPLPCRYKYVIRSMCVFPQGHCGGELSLQWTCGKWEPAGSRLVRVREREGESVCERKREAGLSDTAGRDTERALS